MKIPWGRLDLGNRSVAFIWGLTGLLTGLLFLSGTLVSYYGTRAVAHEAARQARDAVAQQRLLLGQTREAVQEMIEACDLESLPDLEVPGLEGEIPAVDPDDLGAREDW